MGFQPSDSERKLCLQANLRTKLVLPVQISQRLETADFAGFETEGFGGLERISYASFGNRASSRV